MEPSQDFDYVIVGAGSAGCVLAHRLSADPRNRVALVEAGPDYPPGTEPPALLDSYSGSANLVPDFIWTELQVSMETLDRNAPGAPPVKKYEQGRVVGGSSSINGMMANRGAPADYDEWRERGADGWGWDDVLPYFKKLERDTDFDGPMHGQDGPLPIRRLFPDVWPGFTKAACDAAQAAGYPYIADQNDGFDDGVFPFPISNLYDRRVSAAIAYLDPKTRRRENLTIIDRTQVERVLFDGTRATGIEVHRKDGTQTLNAREVIVSSGALHSPALLLRSGIGSPAALREFGLPIIADRPGVGQHLMEHPNITVAAYMTPEARLPSHMRRNLIAGLRYSSGLDECPPGDMFLLPLNKTSWHALGDRIGALNTWVNKSYSTGAVTLAGADWRTPPKVDFNMLSDRRDLERLMAGFRFIVSLYAAPEFASSIHDCFAASYSERVRRAAAMSVTNRAKTWVAGQLMDRSPALRRGFIRFLIADGPPLDRLIADDTELEAYVRRAVGGTWHASCTCRMGAANDAGAVTDPAGRVYGVQGLRVCDASIMPVVPRANTNIPTIMTAEKIADAVLAGP